MKNYLVETIARYPKLSTISNEIMKSYSLLLQCTRGGNKIFTCGNGGSAADAEHIVGELMKGFRLRRELSEEQNQSIALLYPEEASFLSKNLQQAISAISLVNSVSLSTALCNDVNPDFIFAQQVFGLGKPGDVLIAISTSGTSINVIHAAKVARIKEMTVIALTGQSGGELERQSDVTIHAPSLDVASIQEYHLPIYHCLCSMLEEEIFANHLQVVKANSIDKKSVTKNETLRKIDLIVFDFDGVFTNNKVYTNQDGVEFVACDRRDSYGINMLKDLGVKMFILSTETNPVVVARAKKMGLQVEGGCEDKKSFLEKYLQENAINPENVIYMGNDLNDKDAMEIVGFPVAPSDAHPEIINIVSLMLNNKGGNGAVRELCEVLLKKRGKLDVNFCNC